MLWEHKARISSIQPSVFCKIREWRCMTDSTGPSSPLILFYSNCQSLSNILCSPWESNMQCCINSHIIKSIFFFLADTRLYWVPLPLCLIKIPAILNYFLNNKSYAQKSSQVMKLFIENNNNMWDKMSPKYISTSYYSKMKYVHKETLCIFHFPLIFSK